MASPMTATAAPGEFFVHPLVVRGRVIERRPEDRPFPKLAEIYQPDTIAVIQRQSQRMLSLVY